MRGLDLICFGRYLRSNLNTFSIVVCTFGSLLENSNSVIIFEEASSCSMDPRV